MDLMEDGKKRPKERKVGSGLNIMTGEGQMRSFPIFINGFQKN